MGIGIESGGVCLQQRGHLVNKGAGASGADAVHALFHVPPFKINNFCILPAQLNGYVCLGGIVLQGCGYRDHFLYKGDAQVLGERQAARAGNHRGQQEAAQRILGFGQQVGQRFTDICKMPFIVCEQQITLFVQYSDFYSRRANVNAQLV